MNSEWNLRSRTALILLLVLLPGFLALQTVSAKVLPFLTISLSSHTAILGGTIIVTGTLGGFATSAAGTVLYEEFTGGSCSGVLTDSKSVAVTAAGAVPPSSPKFTFGVAIGAGTFSFQAVYSGDTKNYPATSLCSAPVQVIGSPTSIATTPNHLTINVGKTVIDSVTTFTGTYKATATGTITYNLFAGPSCSGTPVQSQTLAITAPPAIPASSAFTINKAGTYSLDAVYSGDSVRPLLNAGSTSSCEGPVTVNKLTPVLATNPSATTITVGGTVSDAASLTGATSTAGGTVTYSLYLNGVCAGTPIASSTVTVTNGVVPGSPNFLINNVGSGDVSLSAVYSGDANNNAVPSACETNIAVTMATPSMFTTPSSFSITAAPWTVTDTATLVGASSNAGGTVTYNLYDDGSCGGSGGTIVQTYTVTVTDGSVPSVSFTFSSFGSYSIQAVYSGDANNVGFTSGCEPNIIVS